MSMAAEFRHPRLRPPVPSSVSRSSDTLTRHDSYLSCDGIPIGERRVRSFERIGHHTFTVFPTYIDPIRRRLSTFRGPAPNARSSPLVSWCTGRPRRMVPVNVEQDDPEESQIPCVRMRGHNLRPQRKKKRRTSARTARPSESRRDPGRGECDPFPIIRSLCWRPQSDG